MSPQIIFGHVVAFCVTAVAHVIIGFGIPAFGLYLIGAPEALAVGFGILGFTGSVIFAHVKLHKWLLQKPDAPRRARRRQAKPSAPRKPLPIEILRLLDTSSYPAELKPF